jgi:hypothetical protein
MDKLDEKTWAALRNALGELKLNKPNDRSEKDRRYAVSITEMEKVVAYFYLYIWTEDEVSSSID